MNEGKRFEQNFKKSVPNDVYFLRLQDSANGFDIANSTQRFAAKSPFDCILYKDGIMYTLELKSTKGKSISFSGSSPMIKQHQIDQLTKSARFKIVSGFIFDFREQETYFVEIGRFNEFTKITDKKSINIKEVAKIGCLIPRKKLQVNYKYDLKVFIKQGGNNEKIEKK